IMADVNAPVEKAPALAPPTRTDEQILPRIRWVPIRKSNCYLDAKKSQSNLIYKIAVDILKHTNFFREFTAFSTIPAIYIQQFWDTICQSTTTWLLLPLQLRILLSTLLTVWVIQKKSNTYLMSLLMTCFNRGGHSRQSSICALRESVRSRNTSLHRIKHEMN
ncbi:hypothetical protein Tco_1396582, partial [Tanacetum coccineum]